MGNQELIHARATGCRLPLPAMGQLAPRRGSTAGWPYPRADMATRPSLKHPVPIPLHRHDHPTPRRLSWSSGRSCPAIVAGRSSALVGPTKRLVARHRQKLFLDLPNDRLEQNLPRELVPVGHRSRHGRQLFRGGQCDRPVIGRDEAEQGATRDDLVVEQHLTVVARIDLCEFVIDASQSERDLLAPARAHPAELRHLPRAMFESARQVRVPCRLGIPSHIRGGRSAPV